MASRDVRWCTNWCTGAWHAPHAPRSDESSRALADAGSCPGNCAGMEEATGAPSSFTAYLPRRLRASGRDGGVVMNRPPSPLTMLFSRHTRRREFITLLGGGAGAPPPSPPRRARAQQPERIRRISLLTGGGGGPDDRDAQANTAAFQQTLQQLGWTDGRNVRIEYRWGLGSADNG